MSVRLLLAEDDTLLREILCEGLADEGFEVVAAEDGVAALERFRASGPFDVLLIDEEMPGLTGRELLSRIRADGGCVPALIISGNLHLAPEECAALGVAEVLRKPISFQDLSRALRQTAVATGSRGV